MIRGVNEIGTDKPVIPMPFVNYSAMTSGELSAVLTKERAKLLLSERPDSPLASDWRKGIDMIDNFLYKGVHNAGVAITGLFSSAELDKFAAVLSKAKKRSEPASQFFLSNDRKIGDPLIPIDKDQCKVFYEGGYGQRPDPARAAACQFQVQMMELFNDPNKGLENSSHYVALYEFVGADKFKDVNAINPQTGYKIDRHKMVIPELANLSKIQHYNIRNWIDLAIRRKNATKAELGPLDPLQSIAILEASPNKGLVDENGHAIGFDPITWLVIAVVIAVSAVSAAGLIQTAQGREPTAFDRIPGILTAGAHAAKGTDWGALGGEAAGNSQCPAGQVRDTVTKQCKPILQNGCDPGFVWKAPTGKCEPEPTDDPVEASAGNKNMIIAAAAAAGLYFLAK